MVEIKTFDTATDLQKPKRIMKYVLVYCSSGSAIMVIHENEFEIKANQVITIIAGQIHFFKKNKATRGFLPEFTFDSFAKMITTLN